MRHNKKVFKLLFIALVLLTNFLKADYDDDYDVDNQIVVKQEPKQIVIKEFNSELSNNPTPKLKIDSIYPDRGPVTGETRVVVRGGPFLRWEIFYPHPFDYYCLQCDFSPQADNEGYVPFQISLTGDFSDSLNSVAFYYYPTVTITEIRPKYGPKNGGTPVQVWGKNFRSFNGTTLCSFGTHTVPADIQNDTYLVCYSPQSDVVQKQIPVSITQNNQQFTRDTLYYWYFNWYQISEIRPNRGPESGDTDILLKGINFHPFKEILDEVDNSPDVWCSFPDLKTRRKATVLNSTEATCKSPPSYYYHQTKIELTLNNVEYTEDENIFYYYKPPQLYDISPREGPLKGGNNISISGTNYEKTNTIQCQFGDKIVPGWLIDLQQIMCTVPMGYKPGHVELKIALKPDLWSSSVKYLYYETPVFSSIAPSCGPDFGYTQIEVQGQNFIDLGSNKAMCVFNNTIFTNATILSDTLLYCDSPAYQNAQGYSLIGSNGENGDFYQMAFTMDGGLQIVPIQKNFYFYTQPKLMGIQPFGGSTQGQTQVTLNVTGLNQPGLCDIQVRFSTVDIQPNLLKTSNQLQFRAPSVDYPGTVVVQVSYNGQQYQNERIIHLKDPLASYEYYQDIVITYHKPQSGPSSGGTKVKINGVGFSTFKPQEFSDVTNIQAPNKLYARFIDTNSSIVIQEFEIQGSDFRNDEAFIITPAQPQGTQILIQLSRNRFDWTNVKNPNPQVTYSFQYYQAPHVTSIIPSYGPVKPIVDLNMKIIGTDFICPNNNCQFAKVRFSDNKGNKIISNCVVQDQSTISVVIPRYTEPDVLTVEISMNGIDYTNDKLTYGYYDPYLIDANPKLINVNGKTNVTVTGLGFVDSGQVKTKFSNISSLIQCQGQDCLQSAQFIDANTILTSTLPQSSLLYQSSGNSVLWDPFTIGVSVYNDQFTYNNIQLYYYHDPVYKLISSKETPANIPVNLLFSVSVNPNDIDHIIEYGEPKCRFTKDDNVLYTEAIFVYSASAAQPNDTSNTPNSIICATPMWLDGAANVTIDITLNGNDFAGNISFTFGDILILHRTVPMAGPIESSSQSLLLLGQGFRASDPNINYESKWGVLETNFIQSSSVQDYLYKFSDWLTISKGNEELKSYWYEAAQWARVDTQLNDGQTYQMYNQPSPKIKDTSINQLTYKTDQGGPFYVEVGRKIQIDSQNSVILSSSQNQTGRLLQSSQVYQYYEFNPSSVEFFHYKQCTMLSMHPKNGLAKGGAQIEVIGFDFRYWPEWGVVPHCKFGDQIVRGYFDSTVRMVCEAPPNELVQVDIPFEVSLNGFDWTQTGFKFSYYLEPKMLSFSPDTGPVQGGTKITIVGINFPNMNDIREINAKFTPLSGKMQTKIMPVKWIDSQHVEVMSPGGWSYGDIMSLQLTFNGQTYDQNGFTFTVYNIAQVKPRSGPSDGSGGNIVISGQGLKSDSTPLCRLNNTVYEAISFSWSEIQCPIVPAQDGPSYFGNVEFSLSTNQGKEWHIFKDGFQYYQQPTVIDIDPKTGPAQGIGVINFYGKNFRSDYNLAELKCKIGENPGVARVVSSDKIHCVVEDIVQVAEGQRLSAQVALNGVSWTNTNDNPDESGSTFFIPYSVTAIFPSSGSAAGGSEILVIGSGFVKNEYYNPRCRFGPANNYAITEAQIVSYNKIICVSPPMPQIKAPFSLPLEMPFSIALTQDKFAPWTQTHHKFRYYQIPLIQTITPNEVQVGLMTEVLITTDNTSDPNNVFFEAYPSEAGKFNINNFINDDATETAAALLMGSQIKCKFGRFGESVAVYVNQTAIKCVTPTVPDDPQDIYKEIVQFSIALNGYDFDYEVNQFEFTFVGTGSMVGLGPQFLTILLCGVLFVVIVLAIQNYTTSLSLRNQDPRPYTGAYGENIQPHLRIVSAQSRIGTNQSRGGPSRGDRSGNTLNNAQS